MIALLSIILCIVQFITSKGQLTSGQSSDYFVFISSPLIQISSSSYCSGKGSIQRILQPVSLDATQFYGWSQACGLFLFDFTNSEKITSSQISLVVDDAIIVTLMKNSNLMIFSNQNMIFLYNFTTKQNPTLISSFNRQISINPPLKFIISMDQNIILLQSKTDIEIFCIDSSYKIVAMNKITLSVNINTIEFISSGYIFLGTSSSMITYKLNISVSSKSVQYELKCTTPSSFNMLNMMLIEDNKQLFIISKFNGIWRVNLSSYLNTQNCDQINLFHIQEQNGYIFMKHLIKSDNLLFLFSEMQFRGIQIFQMKLDSDNNTLFPILQNIEIKDMSYDLNLSNSQNHLIRATDSYISIYYRTSINFQDTLPNIENGEQNVIQQDPEMQSDMARRCTLKNGKFYFAKISDGIFIYNQDSVTNYLQRTGYYKPFAADFEEAVPLTDSNKVVIGASNIHFVDFSNPVNITLNIVNYGIPSFDADSIKLNKAENIIYSAIGYRGFVTINITDFANPVLLSHVYHPVTQYQSSSSENVMLDSKEEYAFVSYRDMGVVVYDVRDVTNVLYVSSIITYSLEDLQLSSDGTFMVLANQERGVMIVDITDKKNMKMISSIFVEGRTQSVSMIQNEQFVLCASLLRGQVQLIDIRDKTNPKILQKYTQRGFTNADYVLVNKNQDVAYVALHSAILIIHLFSSTTQFNVDMILTQSGSTVYSHKVVLESSDAVSVGQVVEIKLNQIFPTGDVILKQVQYYYNYQHYDLPSWAIFSENDQLLTITVSKDSFDKTTSNTITMRSFIYQAKGVLQSTDFIRSDVGFDSTASVSIFNLCKKQNFIDVDSLVIESSQDTILSAFAAYTLLQQQHILYILKRKIFYYPIYLNVQESLFLNLYSTYVQIDTISDTVKLTISVNQTEGALMKASYSGVLVYYTEKQNEMRLEGNLTYINDILQNGGFRVANYTNPQNFSLTMVIDDTINYPINYTFTGSDKRFSIINKPVYVNTKNLQGDFAEKFSGSSVYILESFSYTISSDVFKDDDEDTLTYTAKVLIDGEYQQIPEQYWINFQNQERTIFGNIDVDQYLDNIYLKIKATDGYTETEDYLVIKISQIPLWYIASTAIKILGPLVGLLGLWQYKSTLCNYLKQNRYKTSPYNFYTNNKFNIQIPLLEDQLQIAQTIWGDFYKQLDKKKIRREIIQIKSQMIRFADSKMDSPMNTPLATTQRNPLIKDESFGFKAANDNYEKTMVRTEMNKNIKADFVKPQRTESINKTSSLSNKQDTKILQKLKTLNISEDKFQQLQTNVVSFANIQDIQDLEQEQVYSQIQLQSARSQEMSKEGKKSKHQLIRTATLKVQEKIKKRQSLKKLSKLGSNEDGQTKHSFFLPSGYLNRSYILSAVQQFCTTNNNNNHYKSDIISQLNDDSCKLSRCIIGLCALSFSSLEQTSQTLLKLMKQIAMIEGYYEHEWYKLYVQIDSQPQFIFDDPFPALSLKEESLEKVIIQLQQRISNKEFQLQTDILASVPLIKDCLEAYTLGFTEDKSSFFQKIRGECLEIKPHQILCIKTFRPLKKNSKFCCKRQKETVYKQKELSQNSILPSWISSVDISNGVLLISGHIQNKDAGSYILKIFDTSHFILKEIKINIKNAEQVENDTNAILPSQNNTQRQEDLDAVYEQVEDIFKQVPLEIEIPPIKSQVFKQNQF